MKKTNTQIGYRFPAEWEPHTATWIAWPHNRSDWPGKLSSIYWVYAEIVRKLIPGEGVRILVNSVKHEGHAKKFLTQAGMEDSQIEFFRVPTNRGWMRDFGPLFVKQQKRPSDLAVANFHFNGWARYPDWKKDSHVSLQLAKRCGWPVIPVTQYGRRVVLEGGSIDVNGRGTLLTTEECLLDPHTQVRNPGLSRKDYEHVFRTTLGVTNVLWLGQGITGDDTHGHVDDICRFVGPRTVVLCQESKASDVNYRPLRENLERMKNMRVENGKALEVVPLPMPAPLYFQGRRLPASYANFYISNKAVLVPTFNDPQDRIALGILSDLFPKRSVVGIHAVDLVWGFGTIHCLTQQQPL